MRIVITLSQSIDPDLFNLYYKLGKKRFMKTVKETIRASMMGKVGRLIYVPPYTGPIEEDTVVFDVYFTSKKDETIIHYLETIPGRSRINYIKTILRLNLGLSFIRDEFFSINKEEQQQEIKPVPETVTANVTTATKRITHFPPRKPEQPTVTIPAKKNISTPQVQPVSVPSPTSISQPVNVPVEATTEEEDELFTMLTGLIND